MRNILVIFASILFIAIACSAQETIRICSYNVEWFSGNDGAIKGDAIKRVVEEIQPDILIGIELENDAGAAYLQEEILDRSWSRTPFYGNTSFDAYDVVLYYKAAFFELIDLHSVTTSLRNIELYKIKHVNCDMPFYLAGAHLHASPEATQERAEEVSAFLGYLREIEILDQPIMFCGDFNFYTHREPAYDSLMTIFTDPLSLPGKWHDNEVFAPIHTQSTRNSGVARGGLDDRFDFMLMTASWFDDTGWEYIEESYTTFGNDGQHFNQTINAGANLAVPPEVAQALFKASDHLPLYVDIALIPENPRGEVFYVTQSGKKYHLPTCRFVQGKEGLRIFHTREEAEAAGFEACKVCNP